MLLDGSLCYSSVIGTNELCWFKGRQQDDSEVNRNQKDGLNENTIFEEFLDVEVLTERDFLL